MAGKRSSETPPEVNRAWNAISELESTLKAVDQGRPLPRRGVRPSVEALWPKLLGRMRATIRNPKQHPVVVTVAGVVLLVVGLSLVRLMQHHLDTDRVEPMDQEVFDAYWGAQRPAPPDEGAPPESESERRGANDSARSADRSSGIAAPDEAASGPRADLPPAETAVPGAADTSRPLPAE